MERMICWLAHLAAFRGGRPAPCSTIFQRSCSALEDGHFYSPITFTRCSRWFHTRVGISKTCLARTFSRGKAEVVWKFCMHCAGKAQHDARLHPATLWECLFIKAICRADIKGEGVALCYHQLVTFLWNFPNNRTITIYTVILTGTARSKTMSIYTQCSTGKCGIVSMMLIQLELWNMYSTQRRN